MTSSSTKQALLRRWQLRLPRFAGHFFPQLSPGHDLYSATFVLFGESFRCTLGWNQLVALGIIGLVTVINVRGVQFAGG